MRISLLYNLKILLALCDCQVLKIDVQQERLIDYKVLHVDHSVFCAA